MKTTIRALAGKAALGAVLLAAAAQIGCRHRNGTKAYDDPNGPGSLKLRAHETSGPAIDETPPWRPGHYGSQYGSPAAGPTAPVYSRDRGPGAPSP